MPKKSSTSNRRPPSIPKSVKKSDGGYVTAPVTHENRQIRFKFEKTPSGYQTYQQVIGTIKWTNMQSDSFSPRTRAHFAPQATLSAAVKNTEIYIGTSLPDIV